MASDQQVVLTRGTRGRSSHLPRAARSVVPAFLQKLYEMVSDPSSDNLIRWSEEGKSFYVLDPERFAREVLGRWFKHQNSASFVRQLNMYGFSKLRDTHQGALHSYSETEPWNFHHPNFLRGQPDLLCLIQRKKQATQMPEETALVEPNRDLPTPAMPTANLSPGQILDINSIVNGIAAIKRHQTAISAELSELKESNEQLWQEALAARERHKKHQDTINRILKFLAGVFGHTAGTAHQNDVERSPSRAVVSRKPQRLMIAGSQVPGKEQPIQEVGMPHTNSEAMFNRDQTPDRFATVDPSSASSPAMTDSSAFVSFETPASRQPNDASRSNPINAAFPPPEAALPLADTSSTPKEYMQTTALTATSPSQPSPDAMLQSTLNDMLSNPTQLQRLLAALNAPPPIYPIAPEPQAQTSQCQLTPFTPHVDFAHSFATDANSTQHLMPSSLLPPDHQDSLALLDPVSQSSTRLQKTYTDKEEIQRDIDAVQSSLNSWIESWGTQINAPEADVSHQHDPRNGQNVLGDTPAPDFDFDALWSQIAPADDQHAEADYHTLLHDPVGGQGAIDSSLHTPVGAVTAEHFGLLEEAVASASDGTASPVASLNQTLPEMTSPGTRQKRNSDVAELDGHTKSDGSDTRPSGATVTRAKRKK